MNFGKIGVLSGNTLKIIAALSMTVDHIGVIMFPKLSILRIIGRIAFPLFAFMIAEGCKYTRNKLRYFLSVSCLAVAIQVFYYFFSGETKMSVLVTFSLSILSVYALQYFKACIFCDDTSVRKKLFGAVVLIVAVSLSLAFSLLFDLDYGFFGAMLPLWAAIFQSDRSRNEPYPSDKLDTIPITVLSFSVGVLLLSCFYGGIQYFSLFAIIPLLLYSGKRGRRGFKYFFYIFYPAHIALIYGISLLIK